MGNLDPAFIPQGIGIAGDPMSRSAVMVIATLLTLTTTTVTAEPSTSPAPPEGISGWSRVSWSRVGALPKGVDASALAAWGDGYVLVGADRPDRANRQQGGAWHSTDLSTWSRMATVGGPDDATALSSLVALPSRLIVLGTQQPAGCVGSVDAPCDLPTIIAWASTDGIAWDELTGSTGFGTGTIADVATGPGQALAVGAQGWSVPAIWRSVDGLQWEAEALPADTFADAHLFGVNSFAGGWVVTGMTGGHELRCCDDGWGADETRPAAWWSADGVTWQRAETATGASESGARLGDVFAASRGLVAVDDGDPVDRVEPVGSPGSSLPIKPQTTPGLPQLWTSADGRTWTPVSIDPETAFRPLASDGTAVLGRSTHGGLAVSTDGTDWRTLGADGNAPGAKAPMDWAYMRPAWLVADGLLAVGLDAQGGPTRRLVLASPVTEAQ